jgi:hypothetical protein
MNHLKTITLPPVDPNQPPIQEPQGKQVILTIFAGRKCYLECSRHYLEKLLDKKLLTEVHLWDYSRNHEDSIYIQELVKQTPQFVYKKPVQSLPYWNEYYEYYINANYDPSTILIKCDDDVVYFDIEQFPAYLGTIQGSGLYYPNIVNNDVCAYIQTKYGIHTIFQDSDIYEHYGANNTPLTDWSGQAWYRRYDKAEQVHSIFLEDRNKFRIFTQQQETIQWKGRISINMFGGLYKDIQHYYKLFLEYGKNDDEAFFSHELYKYVDGSNIIVPSMNVVHFAFGPQDANKLNQHFLAKYQDLALEQSKTL